MGSSTTNKPLSGLIQKVTDTSVRFDKSKIQALATANSNGKETEVLSLDDQVRTEKYGDEAATTFRKLVLGMTLTPELLGILDPQTTLEANLKTRDMTSFGTYERYDETVGGLFGANGAGIDYFPNGVPNLSFPAGISGCPTVVVEHHYSRMGLSLDPVSTKYLLLMNAKTGEIWKIPQDSYQKLKQDHPYSSTAELLAEPSVQQFIVPLATRDAKQLDGFAYPYNDSAPVATEVQKTLAAIEGVQTIKLKNAEDLAQGHTFDKKPNPGGAAYNRLDAETLRLISVLVKSRIRFGDPDLPPKK